MRRSHAAQFILFFLAITGVAPAAAGQQTPAPALPTTFVLRIENRQYGRIDLKVGNTGRYALIGRVMKPVAEAAPSPVRAPDEVAYADSSLLVLALGGRRAFGLQAGPSGQAATHAGHGKWNVPAAGTNLLAGEGIFGAARPLEHAHISLLSGYAAQPLPEDYVPGDGDTFLIESPFNPKLPIDQNHVDQLAAAYAAGSAARAKRFHLRVVSGTLLLEGKMPAHEPDPIVAVSFLVDGDTVAGMNTAPFVYEWDTKMVPDGEHVVEIDALNGQGNPITSARMLLVVSNRRNDVPLPAGGAAAHNSKASREPQTPK